MLSAFLCGRESEMTLDADKDAAAHISVGSAFAREAMTGELDLKAGRPKAKRK